MKQTVASNRRIIRIAGPDTAGFLQGLISNDIHKVTPERGIYALLLTPQGKFLHDFFLYPAEDGFLLETSREGSDDLIRRLSFYRLRARVNIEPADELSVSLRWGGHAREPGAIIRNGDSLLLQDPRLAALGERIIAPGAALPEAQSATLEDYNRHRLSFGVPESGKDFFTGQSFALDHGLDHLHAIDFRKGCYVGQEVTARTKHRGYLRRQLYRVETEEGNLPPAGTEIMVGGRKAGEMRSSAGPVGLAYLAEESACRPMEAGGIRFSAYLPGWWPQQAEEGGKNTTAS